MTTMPIPMLARLLLACLLLLPISACRIIYKQDIQQGNVLQQEDVDRLELGMSKRQVLLIMGTPAISDPFHNDRWDYVSTFRQRGGDTEIRKLTLTFDGGFLTDISGDLQPGGSDTGDDDSGNS